jgi:alanine racemase
MAGLTRAEISVAALQNNLRLLKAWTGEGRFFCPMVKTNAYGHDDVLVSLTAQAEGADAVGVARVEEGVRLRRKGVQLPILTFVPLLKDSAALAVQNGLTPVLGRLEDLKVLSGLGSAQTVGIDLEFKTGMQRLGFDESDRAALRSALAAHPQLRVDGVCTHLVYGEDAAQTGGFSQRQLEKFLKMTAPFPGVRHAHKSSSLIALAQEGRSPAGDIGTRPGIAVYGLAHEGHQVGPGLQPVLRWVSELATVHRIEKGETVSYGGRWTAPRRSWVGVVPVGYGDGYMRVLSGKSRMLFRGARVPVVGSVCMDYTLLDLTDVCQDKAPQHGEEIVILGTQGSETVHAVELADLAGTIAYEIVSGIRQRVPREAV